MLIINIIFITIIAYFVSSVVSGLIYSSIPIPAVGDNLFNRLQQTTINENRSINSHKIRNSKSICDLNIFDYNLRPCSGQESESYGPDETVESELGEEIPGPCESSYKLFATTVLKNESDSFALISNQNKVGFFQIGSSLDTSTKIKRIGWRFVILEKNNNECFLDLYNVAYKVMPKTRTTSTVSSSSSDRVKNLQDAIDKGIEVVSDTERNVDQGLISTILEEQLSLMKMARVIPYTESGKIVGFKVFSSQNESLLNKLGLQNGDIVKNINGMDISNPTQALAMYGKLRSLKNLSMVVSRGGKELNLNFNIR